MGLLYGSRLRRSRRVLQRARAMDIRERTKNIVLLYGSVSLIDRREAKRFIASCVLFPGSPSVENIMGVNCRRCSRQEFSYLFIFCFSILFRVCIGGEDL